MKSYHNNEFTIRNYQSGDENQIYLLLIKIFKAQNIKNFIFKIWEWKYKLNPYGFDALIVENKDKKIVGHFGIWIMKILFNGQEEYIHQCVDFCIEKEYRRQNIALRCLKYLIHQNVYPWGFTTEHIYNSKLLDKFENIKFKVEIIEKKLNFLSFRKQKNITTNIKIEPAENPGNDINQFWNKKRSELKISTIRDWKFIKWRIVDSTEKNELFFLRKEEEIIGYIAIKRLKKTCIIQDILIFNNETNKELIIAIEKWCYYKLKLKKIQIMINDQKIYNLLISRKYKIKKLKNFIYFNDNKNFKKSDFYLTFCDTDIYTLEVISI